MKKSITSNLRPLLRALSPFLIAIAVLWAMPRNAHAQHLYVSNTSIGSTEKVVSEYDATTGKVINAKFITGLTFPRALALSDNTLFVANHTGTASFVGKYDATTGGAINPSFITGLDNPTGLAVSDNRLFVSDRVSDKVGVYNATTGAAINASFITLSEPLGLVVSDKDNVLFVAHKPNLTAFISPIFPTVSTYDATTGKVINAKLITGPFFLPTALAVKGNTLYVANFNNGTVGKYSAKTGAVTNADFITGLAKPHALALTEDTLFVGENDRSVNITASLEPRSTLSSSRG